MFFRGAKATPPFLISNFPFLSFLFSLPLYTLPFPPRRAAHLNLTRGFGEVPPCSRNRKHNKMLKVLTNTTYFGETIPWTPPLQLLSGTSPRPLGIAAYVCISKESLITWNCIYKLPTQNDFHQLRLIILLQNLYSVQKSYYTLQFYKILLHTHKFLQHTLCRKTRCFRPWIYREAYNCQTPTWALPLDPAGWLPSPRPTASSPQCLA